MLSAVAEALTGRTEHDLMPAIPEQGAIDWHAEVARAIADGHPDLAEETTRRIVTEAQDAMDEIDAVG